MTDTTSKAKRPSSITLISVFGIYGAFLVLYWIISSGVQEFGLWNTIFLAFIGIAFLVSGIGFWLMKKWAVYTYAVFAALNQVALLVMGRWSIFCLLISAIVVYVGYKHLSKMS